MTTTPIIFPDVELALTAYLRAALATNGHPGVFISNRRESQATAVWVRRDGGPALDVARESARVGVNVFAPTELAVSELARTVSALLRAMPNGAPVLRVTQSLGPSPIVDATPRRYMTFEVTVRGTDL